MERQLSMEEQREAAQSHQPGYGNACFSMRRYAELLAMRHDSPRTRHSYYRAMRLLHEHFSNADTSA